jgi:hypothetical protein
MSKHKLGTQWPNDGGGSGDAVCDLHRIRGGDEKRGFFLVWPQNHYDSFLVWASKPRSMVWPQNHYYSLVIWASKSPR